MPFRRHHKKFGTIKWSFNQASQISTKSIFDQGTKAKDWPLLNYEEIIFRVNGMAHKRFYSQILSSIPNLQSSQLKFKLLWALKRYPEEQEKIFSIFIHQRDLPDNDLHVLQSNKLVLAYFANYYILAKYDINQVKFLCNAIEFFERFDHLVLSDKTEPFLLFGVKIVSDITLLFYSDIKGNGMLIKSKAGDDKISPEREIEILRLGSILKVDVPKQAAVLMLDPNDALVRDFSALDNPSSMNFNNILVQRLIPGAFPLYSASKEELENVATYNCVNLGRMLVFDILTGSWDRHSGNYILHPKSENPLEIRYSLAEIDFGLFDPTWYPPANFQDVRIEEIDENNPPSLSQRGGWALTRHPLVTDAISNCSIFKIKKGIQDSLIKLKRFIEENESNLENLFSPPLLQRILGIFNAESKVRDLFEREIKRIGEIDIDFNII